MVSSVCTVDRIRRLVTALALTLALGVMHGDIDQAVTFSGMDAMAPGTSAVTSAPVMHSPMAASGEHAQHHQPADQPSANHHADMCVSTPGERGAGGSKTGPSTTAVVVSTRLSVIQHQPTISRATGREPPAPNPVTVLCVIRS